MAPRGNPNPKGSKPDKLMRDALMVALHREATTEDGRPTLKLALIADALVDKAAGGDVMAAREIADRVDGKPTQAVEHTDPDGGNPFQPLMDLIAASGRPRPGR